MTGKAHEVERLYKLGLLCSSGSELPVAEQKDNVTNEGETVQERFVPLSRDQEEAINEAKDTLKDAEW